MWSPLHTLSDSCFEHLANLLEEDTRILSDTLRIVSERDYGSLLAVVVSMGKPGLTSALEFGVGHHYWRHPMIGLVVREGRFLDLSYSPGGDHTARSTAWRTVESPEDGAGFIDMIMIRMPNDTQLIESKIANAVSRKQGYYRQQGQNKLS